MDIVKLETLTDEEHIVLVYLNSRVMRLSLKDSLPFLLAVQRNMKVRGTVLLPYIHIYALRLHEEAGCCLLMQQWMSFEHHQPPFGKQFGKAKESLHVTNSCDLLLKWHMHVILVAAVI